MARLVIDAGSSSVDVVGVEKLEALSAVAAQKLQIQVARVQNLAHRP